MLAIARVESLVGCSYFCCGIQYRQGQTKTRLQLLVVRKGPMLRVHVIYRGYPIAAMSRESENRARNGILQAQEEIPNQAQSVHNSYLEHYRHLLT